MATIATYNIRIKNPITEGSKNVSGIVNINRIRLERTAIGSLSGFFDGGVINLTGQPTTAASNDILLAEMLSQLEQEIINKYNVSVSLETYNPEQIEPTTESENNEEIVEDAGAIVEDAGAIEEAPQQITPKNVITPNTTTPTKVPETTKVSYKILEVFSKTIELDELSIGGAEDKKTQKNEDVASIEYPLIKINEYIFSRNELLSMTIDCTDFLPKITVSAIFISKKFIAKDMPKDGDIISIAIRNGTDMLKIIRNDYVITGVHSTQSPTDMTAPVIMTFYGELFVPGLKSQSNDFSFEGTSYYALQDFAKRYNLGFSSNEDNTDDKQIWLKANIAGDIYVNRVTSTAWKDNESFYKSWIDIYYNLNFININKQLMSTESEVGMAALVTNIDKNFNYGIDTNEQKTDPTIKVLSNFIQYKTSPFFVRTWRPVNRASSITFQIGTKMTCEIFEHNKNLYDNPESQKYWAIPVEPTYDDEKTKKMILLRGRATYVQSPDNPEQRRVNYPYVELYQKFPWLGVQYTISNPNESNLNWDGNHHKNYKLAQVQNLINNKELDKLNVHVEVIGNNFNIIKADKIPLVLIRTDTYDNMVINPESKFNNSLDLFYSGWYLVKGFTISWSGSNKQSSFSNFTQEFVLTRREWPAPMPVEPIKTETP